MEGFPEQQPTGDLSDFSDDEAPQPQRGNHGTLFTTMGGADLAQGAVVDRNDYSDEDIKILYEIVIRAEAILTEELTPSSRLPTHALFLAYDEILAEYGLDSSERHISKLVFMVGGVKGQMTMMDKFKAVMARMNITVAIDDPYGSGSEREYLNNNYANNPNVARHHQNDIDNEDVRTNDNYTSNTGISGDKSDYYESSSGYLPDPSTESFDMTRERHLADRAEAFRKNHHIKFSAVATLRRWHITAHYASSLCSEFDAVREAELREGIGDKLNNWRALAAEAVQAAPNNVPANAYSKRTERIAVRTHEILSTKKALTQWRQLAQDRRRKVWDAQLRESELVRQRAENEGFEDNHQLARLAERAHKNLIMSRAFTMWSNRAEEEFTKGEAAAKAYEMSLKAKAFGLTRNRSAMDAMRRLLASRTNLEGDASANSGVIRHTTQPESVVPVVATLTHTAFGTSQTHSPSERPSSAIPGVAQFQIRDPAEREPASSATKPSIISATTNQLPATSPSTVPPPVVECVDDVSASDDDQIDERTMLARRHILRMRYFGAWEKYTSENVAKAEHFERERQNQRLSQSISIWRNEATSRQEQALESKMEVEGAISYQRVAKALLKWREKTRQNAGYQEQVLENYAERAEYYQRTTKALPVIRESTGKAEQREQMLSYYSERANYYLRTTQALSTWCERARDVLEKHQLQEYYGDRADYFYRTRKTLLEWKNRTKKRRKERLKEAHLETRRIVKKGMGERCIKMWRERLEPSFERFEIMNVVLVDAVEDREWQQTSRALSAWRRRACERTAATATGDAMLKQKAVVQWQEKAALHLDVQAEAEEHWEMKAASRALKNWNLSSLQKANRPEMVANALEKKDRRLLRQGFETWYGRTADKLVPVELPDGTYRNVGQLVGDARQQAIENQARGLLHTWKVAANSKVRQVEEEAYAPTPGRPRLLLGSLGRRETTTPLAPIPNRAHWRARDSAMGRSDFGGRASRSERPKNLRVSWAA
ncbi:hypothetical protein F5Y19DRAFT_36450 [Xylariaceae sp. FL1651]|nr:hypothetical protein F5Y19DRAFT_36450 [Xylariaceae sp. FL1651]